MIIQPGSLLRDYNSIAWWEIKGREVRDKRQLEMILRGPDAISYRPQLIYLTNGCAGQVHFLS